MSELRLVVTFPDGFSVEHQTTALTELQKALKDQMGFGQRLSRLPQLSLPGGPKQQPQPKPQPQPTEHDEVTLRVFLLEFTDADACASALRAVGGWYMRYPSVSLSFKADGPKGGINLRLTNFSTVAYAQTVAKINDLMVDDDETSPAAE